MSKFLRHFQAKLHDTLAAWDAQALEATERAIAHLETKLPHDLAHKAQQLPQQLTQGFQDWAKRFPKPPKS